MCAILSLPKAPAVLVDFTQISLAPQDGEGSPNARHLRRSLRSFAVLRRHAVPRERKSTNGGSGSLRMNFH
jgi:hypothetical protein